MLTFGGKVGIIAAICVMGIVGCDGKGTSRDGGIPVSKEPKSLTYSKNLVLDAGEKMAEIVSVVGRDTLKKKFTFEKPADRLVVLSSAQVGYLVRLGGVDRIVAVGEGKYVADSALYARAAAGEVAEIGYGNGVDYEKLMALRPDLIMTFATGGSQDDYQRLGALGLEAMLTSEWQEDSPLAKAEWIKLYGMMLDDGNNGMMARADSIFSEESKKYAENAIHDADRVTCDGPRVLAGVSYGGVWYAPGGRSYTARLIKDAGGCYLWASDTTREMRLTIEDVIALADSADVWVNPGMFGNSDEILAAEPRVTNIRAFREKRVYQNDGRKGPGGGNDFFESAVARPSELLRNLHDCLFDTNCGVNSDSPSEWYHNIF